MSKKVKIVNVCVRWNEAHENFLEDFALNSIRPFPDPCACRGEKRKKTELWRRWCERRKEVCREEEMEGLGRTEAGAGAYRMKALEVAREFKRRTWRGTGGLGRRFPSSVGDPGAPAWDDSHGPTCSSPESHARSQGNGATASALPKERVTIYSGLRFSLKFWLQYLLCCVSMGFSSPSISCQRFAHMVTR